MMNFTQDSAAVGNIELVPQGTLSRAVLSVEKEGFSKPNPEKGTEGGGRYLECKITLVGAPYERRTVFHYLSDPEHPKNSEKAREMGLGALVRMMEAAGVFDPGNPATYRPMSFNDAVSALLAAQNAGRTIAIEVGVQKGTGGYQDKNVVRGFLSPNPKSDSHAKWKKLLAGPAAGPGAGPAAPAPSFMAPPVQQQPAPQAQGFGQSTPSWLSSAQQGTKKLDDEIPF